MLGFLSPNIKSHVLKGCSAVSEKELKHLFTNSMALPHVGSVMIACLVGLGDIFTDKPVH